MQNQEAQGQENLHYRLVQKLNPVRFPKISGVLAAIVGFVLDTTFVEPRIVEIYVSPGGMVLARPEGNARANHFLGRYSDLVRNWLYLISVAGLSQREYSEAIALFASRVGFYGRESA